MDSIPRCQASDFAALPLNTEICFANAPGMYGVKWGEICALENDLAVRLHALPQGNAAVYGNAVWYLEPDGDVLILLQAFLVNGKPSSPTSRFDITLDWVDLDEEELDTYTSSLKEALAAFQTITLALD